MFEVVKPLGDLVTTLPAGPEYPGRTAGPSFELFYESDYVLPHREAAWILLTERIRDAAEFCEPGVPCDPPVAGGLDAVRSALNEIADALAVHLPAAGRPGNPGSGRGPRHPPGPRRRFLPNGPGLCLPRRPRAGRRSRPAWARPTASVRASPGDARTAARLVNSVLRPLADVLPEPPSAPQPPKQPQIHQNPKNPKNPSRLKSLLHPRSPHRLSGTWPSLPPPCGRASAPSAPPGLLEAVAALQDLAVRQAPAGERAQRITELGQLQRALPPAIMTAKNGPYLVTNVPAVRTPLGETLTLPPQLALCRCGGSATKPFCDGTHASNGFTDAKDPNRVPDQRDTYPGQQVTIFDNRGICQHSGLCTDRLPTAFRTDAEPFVAPSGGRMDEIVRAVRDCPSGALSLAFDGDEARDLADWHGQREAAIEVTQDGPYRVTGGIGLTDATGADVPRAAGSSREHYALCRCGHSQNKPFCSGMHWYVEFRDPARGRGADPVRVGRRPARADPDDPAALREARAR